MQRMLAVALTSFTAILSAAQTHSEAPEHYLLTVALAGQGSRPVTRSLQFDIAVRPDHAGYAEANLSTGSTAEGESPTKEVLKLSAIHVSSAGIAAQISYTKDSVSPEPIPGSTEHAVSHMVFEKQVDLPLGVPTQVTDQGRLTPVTPIGHGGEGQRIPAPLMITVTAAKA